MKIREPKPIGDGICELPLGCGRVSLIDEADAELATVCNWHSSTNGRDQTFYVKGRPLSTKGKQGTLVRLHRLLLCFPLLQVDHINRNGLDNRRCNLRLVTQSENMANARKPKTRRKHNRLSELDVFAIQQMENVPARKVAELFGCSITYVHMLRSGKAKRLAS